MRNLCWTLTVLLAGVVSWSASGMSHDFSVVGKSESSALFGAASKCQNPLRQKEGCGEIIDGQGGKKCEMAGTVWALNSEGNQIELPRYCKTFAANGQAGTCGVYDILDNCSAAK
jgi:hypothetical protein